MKKKELILGFILIVFILIVLANIVIMSIFSIKTVTAAQANIEFNIAKSKAIIIIRNTFEGDTTNFALGGNLALENITNMTLEKSSYGKIIFTESINLTQDAYNTTEDELYSRIVDLDNNIIISNNWIEINPINLSSLDKPAILYLYGLTFKNPRILRDNEVCPSSICQIIDYSNGILKFSVTGFTSYSSEETPKGILEEEEEEEPAQGGGGRVSIIKIEEKEGEIQITDFPEKIEIIKAESLEKTIGIKNIGEGNLNNVRLVISGLPFDYYMIIPEKYDLITAGETKTFAITFKADIEEKEYKIKFIVTSDEGSQEVDAVLVVKERKEEIPLFVPSPLKGISPQTWIIIGAIISIIFVVSLIILVIVLRRQKGLKEQLRAMKKENRNEATF